MIHQCDFVPAQKIIGARSHAQSDGATRVDEVGMTETVIAWRCRLCLRQVKSDEVPADGIFAAVEARVMAEAEAAFAEIATDARRAVGAPAAVGALTPQEQAELLRQHHEVAR